LRRKSEDAIVLADGTPPESESVMSKEQLAEFERKLTMLSDSGVEGIYQSAYQECR
jgi:hypothetical protein